jgi:hypothetical protein
VKLQLARTADSTLVKLDGDVLIEVRMDEQFYRHDLQAVFDIIEMDTARPPAHVNEARIAIHDSITRFFSTGVTQ